MNSLRLIFLVSLVLFSCKKTDIGAIQFTVSNKGTRNITQIRIFSYQSPNAKAIYIDSTNSTSLSPNQVVNLTLPTEKVVGEGAFEIRGEDTNGREIKHRFGFFDNNKKSLTYNVVVLDTAVTVR